MEMPEKFKRMRSYEPQTSDVLEVLELMKEMAEALEACENNHLNLPRHSHLERSEIIALKKFKEWKE